ncbi:MAG TPA: hypothetical protein VMS09_20320 [Paenibacillus sp.]|uniref:hypothetical protein n=1 Tax=Paenibacillus sp. TaxID=58172 RepID=UPI002D1C85AC|nr:hypothetical protein [Paenibacillus sp.]HUC94330.1 hypothetical protein [Paenibacillus sp.]
MKECIFHFKVLNGSQSKELRALILLPDDKQPGISDFVRSFEQLGYDVKLENEKELIFKPVDGKEPYLLDITKIKIKGDTEDMPDHDGELRSIVEHLVRHDW